MSDPLKTTSFRTFWYEIAIFSKKFPGLIFCRDEMAENDRVGQVISEGSIMSAWLDLLYREYCRARLSEMRKQLLLSVANDEIPAANWPACDPVGPDDRCCSVSDNTATKTPQPSGNGVL